MTLSSGFDKLGLRLSKMRLVACNETAHLIPVYYLILDGHIGEIRQTILNLANLPTPQCQLNKKVCVM